MIRTLAWTVAAAIVGERAFADLRNYDIDTAHSQVVFSFDHHGLSPVTGIITGVAGKLSFDQEAPATSSVEASIPSMQLTTGHATQDSDILSADFLGAEAAPEVAFRSTKIEVTGADTAFIEGELTLNGITRSVVLDAVLNHATLSTKGVPALGLSGTTTLLRSEYDAGRSAPANSDVVRVALAIEATATPELDGTGN
ncbi:YceI family protein [Cereibacter sp. SYSU M97828]|nr:YceI family protein [Cereibacter flavus]